MKSLEKGFRHLSREDKLKQLVEYGWLHTDNYESLLNQPLINEEVANSLIENVIGQGALPVGLLPKIVVDDKRICSANDGRRTFSRRSCELRGKISESKWRIQNDF